MSANPSTHPATINNLVSVTTPPAPTSTSTSTTSTTPTSSSSSSTTSEKPTTTSTSSTLPTSTPSSTTETSSTPPPATPAPTPATVVTTITPTNGGAPSATTIFITSTASLPAPSDTRSSQGNSATATATSGAASLPTASDASQSSGGLSAGGTIAVAVVVPVASVTLIICVLLWWWRKHKAKKLAEEERRKEVEEYGFNPNNDPTLPGVGVASSYGESYEPRESNSGYRGWGTTSHPRKPSTNLSSGAGLAMSENGSGPGYHHHHATSEGTVQYSDGQGRPESGDADAIAALGSGPAASNNRNGDIRRGPSNASSTYSAHHSEGSEEGHMASSPPGAHYYDDINPYYNDIHAQSPYDNPYGGTPPVIRDVPARRNTRIENPSIFPQQGNAGIAQNF
ncbi:hypothetical protein VTN77DRAFT_6064 [Rasamsonia byssochlamydoides]|uniref:uncharacterized protein n=1 Tax=Rasamsonia byssochlamydoides TaxID=89139 RepID=UPI0037436818